MVDRFYAQRLSRGAVHKNVLGQSFTARSARVAARRQGRNRCWTDSPLTYPQDLHRVQRVVKSKQGGRRDQHQRRYAGAELKPKEILDIIIY
ncbi:MAG: hypothetical protein BJ554DRAFT_7276 [Olpidium bornovanus]|uniref:Uncharacterized protein n=1 Tax=Olpidium bornovanus TaxID=278681 RepID=A0A8H7ZWQ7_9FUNG|nr:MAG: hypothetical protein BJ554DRAFT_7276 [Olpidium bornovanus]